MTDSSVYHRSMAGRPTNLRTKVVEAFEARFGALPARVVRAPGRVNLIGDHTDYNDGFVLPMAIDRAVWIAARPRSDGRVQLTSLDVAGDLDIDLSRFGHAPDTWTEYVRAVAWSLGDGGYHLNGWEGIMAGDVPLGAGLSSSAALSLAVTRMFTEMSGIEWDPVRMATLAQRAENVWVGVKCGIMDQLIGTMGREGNAALIDCRSLTVRQVPVPKEVAVAILDTGTRRGLVDSQYNARREQCEAAARACGVPALRDATIELLSKASVDPVTRRRATHVITENARTVAAADALNRGAVDEVGRLMRESHASLRDDFEVSRRELDIMVDLALESDGCHGARMTGAGFGGCAVALVEAQRALDFVEAVSREYASRSGITPSVYVCSPAAGASAEDLARSTP